MAGVAMSETQALDAPIAATPYWQDDPVVPTLAAAPLPAQVDVLIVGAGYTGLSAARETSSAGGSTLVLEAGALGAGCSGRNGGQVAHSIKPSLATLTAQHGAQRAFAIAREGLLAMEYLRALALDEGLACDWRANGCYFGAHTPRHFQVEQVAPIGEMLVGLESPEIIVIGLHRLTDLGIGTQGGLLLGLLRRAEECGALVVDHCRALHIARERGGFDVATTRGNVKARKVLVATNGYSGPLTPWHRRRVIPIGSYQIATEPLGVARVRELIPQQRNIVDSRRVVVYFRPSPDGERIIYGGRAALAERDPLACVPRLTAMLTQGVPQLTSARITHAWAGWVAYTFDTLPHLGEDDGLFYCMGYCGQGVPLAPYFGRRIGQQIMGNPDGRTALDGLAFASRPYYRGVPWFLAPSVLAYRTLDRLGL